MLPDDPLRDRFENDYPIKKPEKSIYDLTLRELISYYGIDVDKINEIEMRVYYDNIALDSTHTLTNNVFNLNIKKKTR